MAPSFYSWKKQIFAGRIWLPSFSKPMWDASLTLLLIATTAKLCHSHNWHFLRHAENNRLIFSNTIMLYFSMVLVFSRFHASIFIGAQSKYQFQKRTVVSPIEFFQLFALPFNNVIKIFISTRITVRIFIACTTCFFVVRQYFISKLFNFW